MEEFLSPFYVAIEKVIVHNMLYLEKWRISLDNGGYGGGILMILRITNHFAYGFEKNALLEMKHPL